MDFVDDLCAAWERWPPLRKVVAAALGHKPPERASRNYQQLLAMFPGGQIKMI